jgi:nitrogen fixation NifU-like protein
MTDAGFQGTGCAICKASASLMTESLKGKTVAEAQTLCDRLQAMLALPPGHPLDQLGALTVLAGVRQFPFRVKCALLAWNALRGAVTASGEVASTEAAMRAEPTRRPP